MPLLQSLSASWRKRPLPLKAASFAVIGAINFFVDLGVFSLAYYQFDFSILPANILAWGVAVSSSYVMNSLVTFAAESGGRLRGRDYATFALSQTGGLVANTATVFALSYILPVIFAKILAIGVSFIVNFSLSHRFVFRGARKS